MITEEKRTSAEEQLALTRFRTWIDSDDFACVGARSAFNRGSYSFHLYKTLASPVSSRHLAADLYHFAESLTDDEEFITFVAAFEGPEIRTESQFEQRLWAQLDQLHQLDDACWDPSVSADPEDRRFSFSFGGKAFFVVGLHPGASRSSRRFTSPILAFNCRSQFERMREDGRFRQLQRAIRARDERIDGAINPMVADFGEVSEARQYSGRAVDDHWLCPFHGDEK